MLPTVLDIAVAYFLAKRLRHWKNWLPLSVVAGAVIYLVVTLTLTPRLIAAAPAFFVLQMLFQGAVCAACTFGFAWKRRKT